jgi:ABC-type Fe3+ transport system substrate-binding protein
MAGAPNADNGKKFIDWLLRRETEAILAKADSRQIPLRGDVTVPKGGVTLGGIKAMEVDIGAVSDTLNKIAPVVRDILDKK